MRLGASLRLRLPVARSHIPLLVAHLQVAEDTVVLRAVSLLIVRGDHYTIRRSLRDLLNRVFLDEI